MFAAHANQLRDRATVIRLALQAADNFRILLDDPAFEPAGWPVGASRDAGLWLRLNQPNTAAWRQFDHDAALTTLYAAYESCVYKVLREWIAAVLPVGWPNYSADLPDQVRNAYKRGFAKLLPEIGRADRRRYRDLNLGDVARDFADALASRPGYRLHPDLFFTANQNLRHGLLDTLFGDVGLPDAWRWVCHHPALIDYHRNLIGEANTLENELEQFIEACNEAAHRGGGTILGTTRLVQFSHFAERLGTALVEKARHDMYRHYLAVGRAEHVGTVFHVFRGPGAVAVNAAGCHQLTVGEPLGLLAGTSCDFQEVGSCYLEDVARDTMIVVATQQFTLGFARLPREGTQLVRVVSLADVAENGGAYI